MPARPAVVGAVLCGGRSSRMGADKATLSYRGAPMARHVADALRAGGCADVVAIGGESSGHGLVVIPDLAPGEGPLGGVRTALESVSSGDPQRSVGLVFVVPCDVPLLSATIVEALVDRAARGGADVVVATTDRIEPMVAVWSVASLDVLTRSFDRGERSIRRVLPLLDVALVPVAAAELRNVNTPADLVD